MNVCTRQQGTRESTLPDEQQENIDNKAQKPHLNNTVPQNGSLHL